MLLRCCFQVRGRETERKVKKSDGLAIWLAPIVVLGSKGLLLVSQRTLCETWLPSQDDIRCFNFPALYLILK